MIDRGEKRPVWDDEDERDRDITLADKNITKKFKCVDGTVTGRNLEYKLRSQVFYLCIEI